MKIGKRIFGIAVNDKAQAVAEFVIVVPVMFLVFMLLIQYLWIVHAAQLGSYAAYVAGRVYAVRECIDEADAKDKSEFAAALALAPVAGLAPGEMPVGGIGSLSDALAGIAPGVASNVLELSEGYAVARHVRLQENIGGGSVRIRKSGSPAQVDVTINYPQPIFIPGLPELWKLVGGAGDIFSDLEPMSSGLSNSAAFSLVGAYPYVNVRSKCSMGCESWSGTPIQRSQPDNEPPVTDPDLAARAEKMREATEELAEAGRKENAAFAGYQAATAAREAAQQQYDVLVDSGAPPDQIDSAQRALDDAKRQELDARSNWEDARDEREAAQRKYELVTGNRL